MTTKKPAAAAPAAETKATTESTATAAPAESKPARKASAPAPAKAYRVLRAFRVPGASDGSGRVLEVGLHVPDSHLQADLIAEHVSAGDLEEV